MIDRRRKMKITYDDLYEQQEIRATKSKWKQNSIAAWILFEYSKRNPGCEFRYPNTGNFIEDLLGNYFLSESIEEKQKWIELFEENKFQYSESIRNGIYYLFGKKKELGENEADALWPGIKEITQSNNQYTLETVLGTIKVSKASRLFYNTPSAYVFRKQLIGECHERSYDFLKKNQDYSVVLSYMPNLFSGGYYHSYLQKGDTILDIASNSFFDSKESSDKLFNGETIAKLSYQEVEENFQKLREKIPELDNKQKLLSLSLYYDRINHKTKRISENNL